MSELPKIVRQRLGAGQRAESAHLDADLLCALAEQRLGGAERESVLAHLSQCAACREVAALAAPAEEPTQTVVRAIPQRAWLPIVLRWGAVAASVMVVAAAVWMYRPRQGRPVVLTAEKNAPTAAAPSSEAAKVARADQPQEAGKELAQAPAVVARHKPAPEKSESYEAKLKKDQAARGEPATAGLMAKAAPAMVPPPPQGREEQPSRMAAAPAQSAANAAPAATDSALSATPPAARDEIAAKQAEARPQANEAAQPQPKARAATSLGATETVEVQASAGAVQGARVMERRAEPQWSISAKGEVQVSRDAGASWQKVKVAKGVRFLAVSAHGNDAWAGGSGGALYHSTDGGKSWVRVPVGTDEDIVRVSFDDALHGSVATAVGAQWATDDAGKTWRKK